MLNWIYTLFWKHRIFVKKRDVKYDMFVTIVLLRFKIIALCWSHFFFLWTRVKLHKGILSYSEQIISGITFLQSSTLFDNQKFLESTRYIFFPKIQKDKHFSEAS